MEKFTALLLGVAIGAFSVTIPITKEYIELHDLHCDKYFSEYAYKDLPVICK